MHANTFNLLLDYCKDQYMLEVENYKEEQPNTQNEDESSHLIEADSEVEKIEVDDTQATFEKDKSKNLKIKLFIKSGLFIILLICSAIFYFYENDKKNIYNLIENCNLAEFDAYKKVPEIDTQFFNLYFTNSKLHPNKKEIKEILQRRQEKGSTLIEPSSYKILEKKVISFNFKKAKIQTLESWRMDWSGDSLKYDVKNIQTYYMVKINGKWLIEHNKYEGKRESKK